MCPFSVYLTPAQTVQRDRSPVLNTLSALAQRIIIPHRCIAGGCSNIRKDGVSLHKWPEDAHFAELWTNAVKNTRSDIFNPTTSWLCSSHFTEDSFEEQSVIAKSLGLKLKNIFETQCRSYSFKNGPLQTKNEKTTWQKYVSRYEGNTRSL